MTSEPQPRIEPLPQREWGRAEIDAIEPMTPPPGSIYERRREARGGAGGVNALALLLRNPALCRAFLGFNRHLLYESSIDDRVRELAVLRVSHRLGSDYEWAQHVPVALECGMTADEIGRVRLDDVADWSPFEAAVLGAVDGLLRDGHIDDGDWAALAGRLDERELLDLVFTIGGYATIGMVFNSAGLAMDPDIVRYADFPAEADSS